MRILCTLLVSCLVLSDLALSAEEKALSDQPIEIEESERVSQRARSALRAYHEARRMRPRPAVAGLVRSATPTVRSKFETAAPLPPGSEEPDRVFLNEQPPAPGTGLRLPQDFDAGSGFDLDLDLGKKPEVPVEHKKVDPSTYRELNQTRGFFINRGGGLQYFQRSSDTFGKGYSNAYKIRRSQYERVSPYRGPQRRQEKKTAYRGHLSRDGRQNRTRSYYR